jgi:hypothetical protein
VHQHAGVAAGHHAGIARLALIRNSIEVENRTQWLVPRLASPDVEPVAVPKARGSDQMPAPTIEPTTIIVSANS